LLDQDKPAWGAFISIGAPAIVEIAGHAGYDFVVVDMEHTSLDFSDVENMIRAGNGTGISVSGPATNGPTNRIVVRGNLVHDTASYGVAAQGAALGEVPVGAVLVQDGEIIGRGFNCPISGNDPSAHAEMVAIRAAALAASNYRLPGSTLYVTLEPCSMCAGLIVHSRIARVVYGALEPKAGIVQSQGQFFTQGFLNHRVLYEGGVLAEECGAVLSEFFKARRAKPTD